MTQIRPKKSGMVVFLARIFSTVTGLVFLTMITRAISADEFGFWEFILDLVVFASYPAGLFTYWSTREVARGIKAGKTVLFSSLLTSLVGIVVFFIFSFSTYRQINTPFFPFVVASFLVPLNYWSLSSSSIVAGYNPAITGYSLFFSETAKLVVAYFLLFIRRTGIIGVIISVCVSYAVQSGISTYMTRGNLGSFEPMRIKVWLSGWYVPAVYTLGPALIVADTFVVSLGQKSTLVAGYFQAAFQIATVIGYSGYLASSLYPLLLQNKEEKLVSELLDYTLLFAIPMSLGAIFIGRYILYFLSPTYVKSYYALIFLSLASVLTIFSNILDSTLLGKEKVDTFLERSFRDLIKSNLMFVSLVNFIYSTIYVVTVYIVSLISVRFQVETSVLLWALSQFAILLLVCVIKEIKASKFVKIAPSISVVNYIISSVAMGIIVYLLSLLVLNPNSRGAIYGIGLAGIIAFGACIYFGILYVIDKRFRRSAKLLFSSYA